jgi:hypothetical protein
MITWQVQPVKVEVHSVWLESAQYRPLQQALAETHPWPMPVHVLPGWQVPLVEPGLSTQVSGGLLQQSALELQVAPCGWHTGGGPQAPLVQ